MESSSQQMDEMDMTTTSIARRTQSDLGGEAVIAAALSGSGIMVHHRQHRPIPMHGYGMEVDHQDDDQIATVSRDDYGIPGHSPLSAVTAASRKLTRHLAKAQLRRSASQPVVVFVAHQQQQQQQLENEQSLSSTPASSVQQLLDRAEAAPIDDSTGKSRVTTRTLPFGYSTTTTSDEDAGLCLSEDDNLSDNDILTDNDVRSQGRRGGGQRQKQNLPQVQAENESVRYNAATEGVLAIALWDHNAVEAEELSLKAGDIVHVLDLSDPDWWWAARSIDGQQQLQSTDRTQLQLHQQMLYGWLPASYVQLCEQPLNQTQENQLQLSRAGSRRMSAATSVVSSTTSSSSVASPSTMTITSAALLQQSVRANVINELITAERDYVKLLSDLVDV